MAGILPAAAVTATNSARPWCTRLCSQSRANLIAARIRAALNEFIRQVAKHFRHIKPADLRVILLHAGERLLPELPDSLARFAQGILEQRGVVIRCHTRLHGATAEAALLVGGERLPTRTLVSTVPTAPNPLVAGLPVATERGRIVVNEHLEVPGIRACGRWGMAPGSATPRPACPAHPPRSFVEQLITSCLGNLPLDPGTAVAKGHCEPHSPVSG